MIFCARRFARALEAVKSFGHVGHTGKPLLGYVHMNGDFI
jgi:hypothetical protein